MIVIATELFLSVVLVSMMVMWESSQWFGKNIVQSSPKKNSWKAWIGAIPAMVYTFENGIEHHTKFHCLT